MCKIWKSNTLHEDKNTYHMRAIASEAPLNGSLGQLRRASSSYLDTWLHFMLCGYLVLLRITSSSSSLLISSRSPGLRNPSPCNDKVCGELRQMGVKNECKFSHSSLKFVLKTCLLTMKTCIQTSHSLTIAMSSAYTSRTYSMVGRPSGPG